MPDPVESPNHGIHTPGRDGVELPSSDYNVDAHRIGRQLPTIDASEENEEEMSTPPQSPYKSPIPILIDISSELDSVNDRNLTINTNTQVNHQLITTPPTIAEATTPTRSPLKPRKLFAGNVKGKNVKDSATCSDNVPNLRRSSRNKKNFHSRLHNNDII
jgi:hypothetical protein